MKSAYDEGVDAWVEGMSRADNPYSANDSPPFEKTTEWQRGYDDARLSPDLVDERDRLRTRLEERDKLIDHIGAMIAKANASSPEHPTGSRRVLILASYCGGENPECSDDYPCLDCLKMCNVATATGVFRILGGLDYLRRTNAPDQQGVHCTAHVDYDPSSRIPPQDRGLSHQVAKAQAAMAEWPEDIRRQNGMQAGEPDSASERDVQALSERVNKAEALLAAMYQLTATTRVKQAQRLLGCECPGFGKLDKVFHSSNCPCRRI